LPQQSRPPEDIFEKEEDGRGDMAVDEDLQDYVA
jgi:hypothetical protein